MTPEELKILSNKARQANNSGNLTEGEAYSRELLSVTDKETYPDTYLLALYCLTFSLGRRGMGKEALPYAQEAYLLADEIKSPALPDIAGAIGLILKDYGNYVKALEFFTRALEVYEERGAAEGIGRTSDNIGTVYSSLEDYERAIEYHQKALEVKRQGGGTAGTLSNIGNAYAQLKQPQKALEYYKQAYEMLEDGSNQQFTAIVAMNMAIAYRALGNYQLTLQWMEKSMDIHYKAGDKEGKLNGTMQMGELYFDDNFPERDDATAENYFKAALVMAEDMERKSHLVEIHRSLYKLCSKREEWKEGLKHLEALYQLEKEIKSDEAKRHALMLDYNRKQAEAEREQQIKIARFQEQEKILHNILPAEIAERMLDGEKQIADYCEDVSVFFSDIVGFTQLSQSASPAQVVDMLNELFTIFDKLARKHGLEKIKTIGDSYMAVAGVPKPAANHAEQTALFALEVLQAIQSYSQRTGSNLQVRIGLHCGHAVAGVIGDYKFDYDLWGDAVNTASRMESHGEPGRIQVSEDFRNALKDKFEVEERGAIEVKGKGMMKTYFLIG